MQGEPRNRFDQERPFDVLRAEDFGDDLHFFYEPLEALIRRSSGVDIAGSRPVFLIGGRGTGKTMVLKSLSLDMQLKRLALQPTQTGSGADQGQMALDFLNKTRFVGVYLHFRTTEYDPIRGEIESLFEPYLAVRVAEQLFRCLALVKSTGAMPAQCEQAVVGYFAEQVKEPGISQLTSVDSVLRAISKELIPRFEEVFMRSAAYSLDEIRQSVRVPVIVHKNLFFELPMVAFDETPCLKGKNLFVLLDELEYLGEYQKRRIGQLVKDSDETATIFKIGSRYMPERLYVGDSSEVLQEGHDYRKIEIADALNAVHGGKKTDYSDLIRKILNRRLEKSEYFRSKGITNVDALFPGLEIEQEALSVVSTGKQEGARGTKHWQKFRSYLRETVDSKQTERIVEQLTYPDNPIIEKLNMLLFYRGKPPQAIRRMMGDYLGDGNPEYDRLYKKNALNLLFQLYSDFRREKRYTGVDTFIHLSSGIIRSAIELCNEALNTAYNYGYKPVLGKPVESVYQDRGAKNYSELQFNDILTIPGGLGGRVKDLVNELGTVFRELHLDKNLVEPEPTHFETAYSQIHGEAREVFDAALNYSYLQRKPPMEPKSPNEAKRDDFLTNRILAPHFEISYRARGRTTISADQIAALVTGDDKRKKATRRAIIRANAKKDAARHGGRAQLFDEDQVQ